jgi:hypothetical protein
MVVEVLVIDVLVSTSLSLSSPVLWQWMVKSRVINDLQEACWDMVSAMAGDIILLLDSDNDGIRTHAIKFVEGLIVTLSPRMADSEIPRRQEHDISLDRIPRDHPYIQYSECCSSPARICWVVLCALCHIPHPSLLHFLVRYRAEVKSLGTLVLLSLLIW